MSDYDISCFFYVAILSKKTYFYNIMQCLRTSIFMPLSSHNAVLFQFTYASKDVWSYSVLQGTIFLPAKVVKKYSPV